MQSGQNLLVDTDKSIFIYGIMPYLNDYEVFRLDQLSKTYRFRTRYFWQPLAQQKSAYLLGQKLLESPAEETVNNYFKDYYGLRTTLSTLPSLYRIFRSYNDFGTELQQTISALISNIATWQQHWENQPKDHTFYRTQYRFLKETQCIERKIDNELISIAASTGTAYISWTPEAKVQSGDNIYAWFAKLPFTKRVNTNTVMEMAQYYSNILCTLFREEEHAARLAKPVMQWFGCSTCRHAIQMELENKNSFLLDKLTSDDLVKLAKISSHYADLVLKKARDRFNDAQIEEIIQFKALYNQARETLGNMVTNIDKIPINKGMDSALPQYNTSAVPKKQLDEYLGYLKLLEKYNNVLETQSYDVFMKAYCDDNNDSFIQYKIGKIKDYISSHRKSILALLEEYLWCIYNAWTSPTAREILEIQKTLNPYIAYLQLADLTDPQKKQLEEIEKLLEKCQVSSLSSAARINHSLGSAPLHSSIVFEQEEKHQTSSNATIIPTLLSSATQPSLFNRLQNQTTQMPQIRRDHESLINHSR